MPALACPAVIRPGQLGPMRRVAVPRRNVSARIMSSVGMPSVMHTTSGSRASAASMTASAANGGGTKITRGVGARLAHRIGNGVEDRPSLVGRAALAGRDAADDLGAVCGGLLRVKRAFPAREPLHDEPRGLVDR